MERLEPTSGPRLQPGRLTQAEIWDGWIVTVALCSFAVLLTATWVVVTPGATWSGNGGPSPSTPGLVSGWFAAFEWPPGGPCCMDRST